MRNLKLILIFIFSIMCINSFAQMYYMPDAILRQRLSSMGLSACIIGDSIDGSCPAVLSTTTLFITGLNISDLTGMAAFSNLQYLDCIGNNLTSLPLLPNKLRTLYCYSNHIISISILPDSIKDFNCANNNINVLTLSYGIVTLNCSNNNLNSLVNIPTTLKHLEAGGNNLTLPFLNLPNSLEYLNINGNSSLYGPPYLFPDSLKTLLFVNCHFSSVPSFPSNLEILNCDNNNLDSLPSLPNTLQHLTCTYNALTNLPSLPNGLVELGCSYNLLTALPALPISITSLSCGNNQLLTIPSLPAGIQYLECSANFISSLPTLPNSIATLYIQDNQFSSLPAFPNLLSTLDISKNSFTSIPALPSTLYYFKCSENPLDSLPVIPNSLFDLFCAKTNITSLPLLPDSMRNLNCDHNPLLNNIPELPRYIQTFNCSDNPNLHCLPEIGKIISLFIDSTGIQCLSGYGQITYWSPNNVHLPICDLYNINNCPFFYNILGQVFFDADSNCIMDTNEIKMPNIPIRIYKNGQFLEQVNSNVIGEYYFDADTNNFYSYFIDTTAFPFLVECPPGGVFYDTLTTADTVSSGNNFGLKCNTSLSDAGVWSIVPALLRPGTYTTVYIHAGNPSLTYGISCSQQVFIGTVDITWIGNMSYYGPAQGAPAPLTIGSNSLQYTINDFVNMNGNLGFVLFIDSNVAVGSSICFNVVVNAIGNTYPVNDSLTMCFTVNGSYDPNDKTVFPEGYIASSINELTYTIRFQNTGTDTAFNIHVIDTLDSGIDPASFQLLSTSHPCYFHLYSGNVMKFSFPDIQLPDSFVNEPLSHGYVQYKVRLKNNLPLGRQIENRAHIYFDYNPAVVTNSTMNEIALHTGSVYYNTNSESIYVLPNPFSDQIKIVSGKSESKKNYSITDILGNEILSGSFSFNQTIINTSHIKKGIYFLRIVNQGNYFVHKIVK